MINGSRYVVSLSCCKYFGRGNKQSHFCRLHKTRWAEDQQRALETESSWIIFKYSDLRVEFAVCKAALSFIHSVDILKDGNILTSLSVTAAIIISSDITSITKRRWKYPKTFRRHESAVYLPRYLS
jgi:hypothetical protein